MEISITSEITPLKKVLLHRPGKELEHLIPDSLERLLFDDIPYLSAAVSEHDRFADVLRGCGAETIYLEDLAAETIAASCGLKEQFVDEFISSGGAAASGYREELRELLLDIKSEKELILKTMSGVNVSELGGYVKRPLVALLDRSSQFVLDPIPNLYFTRDTFASIGHGISLNRMFSTTRSRESIYAKYIFKYHRDYRDTLLYYTPDLPFCIEGGDILALSKNVIGVGISQRTKAEAIETLAQNIFSDPLSAVDTVLAFLIPSTRAFMHLDTVFTQVDEDKFTIHPGIMGYLRTFEIKSREGQLSINEVAGSLDEILAKYLGLDSVRLINCGGQDRVASEREQWNDGSNTLCVKPGVVIVYDRNLVTNRMLEENGIVTIPIPSSELSRGRGGPRCMSMPLVRE